MEWCEAETMNTCSQCSQYVWQTFPLKIKNILHCPHKFAAMPQGASVQLGSDGCEPYLSGKDQVDLKTDRKWGDAAPPPTQRLKLHVPGGASKRQERGWVQAARAVGVTVQKGETIPSTICNLQILKNIFLLYSVWEF